MRNETAGKVTTALGVPSCKLSGRSAALKVQNVG